MSASSVSSAAFDALVAEYYRAWFRFHPTVAVQLGVPGYGGLLAPYDDDDIGALVTLHEKLLAELDAMDTANLDADRQLDAQLLLGQAQIEHHALLEQDWRRRDPVGYVPIGAIHQLMVMPVADFASALQTRVAQIPSYLRGARAHLHDMPELVAPQWLESAVTMARSAADYLRGLKHHPKVQHAFPKPAPLHESLERAARALVEYAEYLETDVAPRAQGDFACGRAQFERILQERHGLQITADQLHQFGSQLFEQTQQALLRVTAELRADADPHALWVQICQDHPNPTELLDEYQAQMQAARDFVIQQDLVSLPQRETLDVVETPTFLRHQIPFAAYKKPMPGDPAQQGYYYVTPPTDGSALAEHNRAGLMHTCVHEAWPGHHLQFVTAHQHPAACSWPRLINTSATLYEGWALYAEQLMQEQGFLARPEQRFILLRDRLWRALRIVLDVELHTRGLRVSEAAERMQTRLGFPRAQALADLAWYTRSPGVPMGYATGWALLTASRARLVPSQMSLKAFHDRLLAVGSVGLAYVLQRAFGAELCRSISDEVLGPQGSLH